MPGTPNNGTTETPDQEPYDHEYWLRRYVTMDAPRAVPPIPPIREVEVREFFEVFDPNEHTDIPPMLGDFEDRIDWLNAPPVIAAPEAPQEASDMRRANEDGSWTEDSRFCADAVGRPIRAGKCVYIGPFAEASPGTLLGVGKQGTWRVKGPSGKVVSVQSRNIAMCGPTWRGANRVAGEMNLRFVAASKARYAQLVQRLNTLPVSKRIRTVVQWHSRMGGILRVDLSGNIMHLSPGRWELQPSVVPPECRLSADLESMVIRNVELLYSADIHDPRFTRCGYCGDVTGQSVMIPITWGGRVPHNTTRYTHLCPTCVGGIRRNNRYGDCAVTCVLHRGNTATIEFLPQAVRILTPCQVQQYSLHVEDALPWIGKGPLYFGLEIEGSSARLPGLLQAVFADKLAVGKSDSSICATGNRHPVEVVTTPIDIDPAIYRPTLAKLVKHLADSDFAVNDSCGGHVHITAAAFTKGEIARLRYAFAKYPEGWSLIFGRPFGYYCPNRSTYNRVRGRDDVRHITIPANPLDAFYMPGRGAINVNSGHGTHEFRAFAGQCKLPHLLANVETVLALREWCKSMPSDWTVGGYLRFLDARALADTWSKKLAHKGKVITDRSNPFMAMQSGLDADSPPLAYARALAGAAVVAIRQARIAKYSSEAPQVTPAPVKTNREHLIGVATARRVSTAYDIIYCLGNRVLWPGIESLGRNALDNDAWYVLCRIGVRDIVTRNESREFWDSPYIDPDIPQVPNTDSLCSVTV